MKRTERFPDTQTFHYYNANPKNRITTDCVARALSVATEIPYTDIVRGLAEAQCITGYATTENRAIDFFLTALGWTKHKQPRKIDGTKYTGKEFCLLLQADSETLPESENARYIANVGGGHIVAIVNGRIYDTWDSTGGCIGNYWSK